MEITSAFKREEVLQIGLIEIPIFLKKIIIIIYFLSSFFLIYFFIISYHIAYVLVQTIDIQFHATQEFLLLEMDAFTM